MSIHRLVLCIPLLFASVAFAQDTQPDATPATAPTTEPALHADQTTPHGAIQVWLIANAHNDGDAIRNVLIGDNDAERRMVFAIGGLADAQRHLADALKAKFPSDYHDSSADADAVLLRAMPQIAIGEETINGDTAVFQRTRSANPITLRRDNGQWRLPIATIFTPHDAAALARQQRLFDAQIQVLDDATNDVAAGKYVSLAEASDAIKHDVGQAILRARTQPADNQ